MMKLSEFIEKHGDCEVTEELMKMVKEPKGDWKPKAGEEYLFIDSRGFVGSNTCNFDEIDLIRIQKRNCYKTQEEVKFALDMYNFCKERSFEPDWKDENQYKYFLSLRYDSKTVDCGFGVISNNFKKFYYPTREAVEEVINKYTFEELEKYYGRV